MMRCLESSIVCQGEAFLELSFTLEKHEKMEVLSLLELAALEAAGASLDHASEFTPSLQELGITCGLQVIIPLVKSFLGDS